MGACQRDKPLDRLTESGMISAQKQKHSSNPMKDNAFFGASLRQTEAGWRDLRQPSGGGEEGVAIPPNGGQGQAVEAVP